MIEYTELLISHGEPEPRLKQHYNDWETYFKHWRHDQGTSRDYLGSFEDEAELETYGRRLTLHASEIGLKEYWER